MVSLTSTMSNFNKFALAAKTTNYMIVLHTLVCSAHTMLLWINHKTFVQQVFAEHYQYPNKNFSIYDHSTSLGCIQRQTLTETVSCWWEKCTHSNDSMIPASAPWSRSSFAFSWLRTTPSSGRTTIDCTGNLVCVCACMHACIHMVWMYD